ncbi:hypothetical protein GYMLUDRAFT_164784 [Collybiopsis luxurians FD-317 M1]|uniref:Glycosyltransferase 61 catalytic domain-containing protein n=1 Tax=Collybiopsis luxurians FD-317 M1 TaxID=944289 RepID=A0A0D0CIV1_9AGAR|nr:hypothetical protein GYMLUDRAFT_164784 [Collybiopsis luxurians FD-317 M1]
MNSYLSQAQWHWSNSSPLKVAPAEISAPDIPLYDDSLTDYREYIDVPYLPSTKIPGGAHSHGFTIFDNLYLRNGTFYVVTTDRESFPTLDALIAAPFDLGSGFDTKANSSHLQFIDPPTAMEKLGTSLVRLDDFTVVLYDPKQFMTHYYHWWGEIILGFWRVYSMLGQHVDGSFTSLPFPNRFLLPFVAPGTWRDRAGVNGPLMRAANPAISIESSGLWNDMIALDETIVFTRVGLISRETAHRHPFGHRWFKMMASTMSLSVPVGFWEPLRKAVVTRYGLSDKPKDSSKPVVTYISRQSTGRRLTNEAHEGLIKSLKELKEEGLCDVHIPVMEHLNLRDQIELASTTTIMVGVHGNGLTHQLWMPPSSRATVIEIMFPEGYVFDYEMLARNMGHKHYAVWNDTFVTYPQGTTHEGVSSPDGFHGSQIPVYGPTVASIIRDRLSGENIKDDIELQ